MLIYLIGCVLGIAFLYFGGGTLVDGSCALARRYHIRPFVIGAVVIGFGTSAPEAFVSVVAQWKGSSDIAFGNFVGSSITNMGLILGIAALLAPIAVERRSAVWEYSYLVFVSLLMAVFASGSELSRMHAWVFLGLFALFLWWSLKHGASDLNRDAARETGVQAMAPWLIAAKVAGGLIALLAGSELLVRSGVAIARQYGMSELAIGSSLIAVGTSLPELAASSIAAVKRQGGIAFGNVVGSNLFNLLLIPALALLIRPIPIGAESHRVLVPALVVLTLLAVPFLVKRNHLGRAAGVVFLAAYGVFLVFLFAFGGVR